MLLQHHREIIFIGMPFAPAQPEIAPDSSRFCNTSPNPNPAVDRFRYFLGHQLSYPIRSNRG